jgi:uncharacterized protein YajQ (UPF0234 family)
LLWTSPDGSAHSSSTYRPSVCGKTAVAAASIPIDSLPHTRIGYKYICKSAAHQETCKNSYNFAVVRSCYTSVMANFSFDVVSEYDKSEMNNVFDQTDREIDGRYDFKNTPAAIEWLDDKKGIKITGNGEWQIDAILDIIRKKLATRGQSQKVLDTSKDIVESNLKSTKEVPFKQGLDQEKAKQITKLIREQYPKVKPQIQGDAVRVTSSSKDDLQAVMQLLREQDLDFPVSFTNYR